jgi:hypothetical protein
MCQLSARAVAAAARQAASGVARAQEARAFKLVSVTLAARQWLRHWRVLGAVMGSCYLMACTSWDIIVAKPRPSRRRPLPGACLHSHTHT